jgi:hypothetical protein
VPIGHVPTSGAENYPSATMGPLAGTASFPAESQGMPIQSSMEPPVPLSMVTNDSEHPPVRSQYTYMQTTTAPPQLSIQTTPLGGHEQAMNIPRYVDNPRPLKSPRHMSHPSIRSAGSVARLRSQATVQKHLAHLRCLPGTTMRPRIPGHRQLESITRIWHMPATKRDHTPFLRTSIRIQRLERPQQRQSRANRSLHQSITGPREGPLMPCINIPGMAIRLLRLFFDPCTRRYMKS